jgi:hypothetical protein
VSVDRTEVLVSQDVTEVVVPAEVTEVLVPTGSVVVVSGGGGGGGGGTSDHSALSNRGLADQHPTAAITGLDSALSTLTTGISTEQSARIAADAVVLTAAQRYAIAMAIAL